MASTSQQTLLTAFNQASGSPAGGQSSPTEQGLIDALGQATQVIDAQTQATSANTDALAKAAKAQGSSRRQRRIRCPEHGEQVTGGRA